MRLRGAGMSSLLAIGTVAAALVAVWYATEEVNIMCEKRTWDTKQLQEDFTVEGFTAGFCVVVRKSDGVRGTLDFDHHPRLYYRFTPID